MPRKPATAPDEFAKARGTCQSCTHWHAQECRRYPPQILVVELDDGSDGPAFLWPLTESDEFCGEHKGNT